MKRNAMHFCQSSKIAQTLSHLCDQNTCQCYSDKVGTYIMYSVIVTEVCLLVYIHYYIHVLYKKEQCVVKYATLMCVCVGDVVQGKRRIWIPSSRPQPSLRIQRGAGYAVPTELVLYPGTSASKAQCNSHHNTRANPTLYALQQSDDTVTQQ